MYRGKHLSRKKRRISKRTGILLASIVLILGITTGTTAAYLLDNTDQVTNTFTPADVSVEVKEDFSNNVKENVAVKNNSDIKVYVRATISEYWKKGNDIVAKPANGKVTKIWGSDWLEGNGNVYYYKTPLDPNASTSNLLNSVTVTIPEGYTYHLDVYAEAIQAEPTSAAIDAWGVTITDGSITAVG